MKFKPSAIDVTLALFGTVIVNQISGPPISQAWNMISQPANQSKLVIVVIKEQCADAAMGR